MPLVPVRGRRVPVTRHLIDERGILGRTNAGRNAQATCRKAVDFCNGPSCSISYAGTYAENLNDRPQRVTGSPFDMIEFAFLYREDRLAYYSANKHVSTSLGIFTSILTLGSPPFWI